jgi:hypothetical protein
LRARLRGAIHGGTRPTRSIDNPPLQPIDEVAMSADRDRGIRRQKQKRAKDSKKKARQQRQAGAQPSPVKSPAQQKAE